MTRTGLVDDHRFAAGRATVLAERGSGDALIRHDLRRRRSRRPTSTLRWRRSTASVSGPQRIVARRGVSAKTARYLAGKGFSEDVVHAVIAHSGGQALG